MIAGRWSASAGACAGGGSVGIGADADAGRGTAMPHRGGGGSGGAEPRDVALACAWTSASLAVATRPAGAAPFAARPPPARIVFNRITFRVSPRVPSLQAINARAFEGAILYVSCEFDADFSYLSDAASDVHGFIREDVLEWSDLYEEAPIEGSFLPHLCKTLGPHIGYREISDPGNPPQQQQQQQCVGGVREVGAGRASVGAAELGGAERSGGGRIPGRALPSLSYPLLSPPLVSAQRRPRNTAPLVKARCGTARRGAGAGPEDVGPAVRLAARSTCGSARSRGAVEGHCDRQRFRA
ncbi:Protein of unknown function [Gryllus bimaculatus]|nr:Protein of unknown function [Gryllus bimaculatus]